MSSVSQMMIRNGTYFDFSTPEAADFTLDEIAWGLSNVCRYSGQGAIFYSVAEHAVLVSQMVYELTQDKRLAFQGLMHDATEAFLPDMPKPAKILLPDYVALEARIWKVIANRWELPEELHPAVHMMDVRILAYEGGVMFPNATDRWWERHGPVADRRFIPQGLLPEAAFLAFWDQVDFCEVDQ